MSDAWGAVVAAVAAGVFGIIGILAGILVGRRQTVDQAAVEHGQWLRGQRQQAFATYLDTWDRACEGFKSFADDIDEHTDRNNFHPDRYEEELAESVGRLLDEILTPTLKPYEHLMLLVPDAMKETAVAADNALLRMLECLEQLALCDEATGSVHAAQGAWAEAVSKAELAREELFQAARTVLLEPPSPKRQ